MDDLISRAAAIDALTDTNLKRNVDTLCDGDMNRTRRAAQRVIAQLPAVDATPVVHGRWVDENPGEYLDPRMRCSVCTAIESPLIKWQYCPDCGARMDGDAEWIEEPDRTGHYHCSTCGVVWGVSAMAMKHCPNCTAKMTNSPLWDMEDAK